MEKAIATVNYITVGFTKTARVAEITVDIPSLGRTGYTIGVDKELDPQVLEEYRLRGEREIPEVIAKHSGKGVDIGHLDDNAQTSNEGTRKKVRKAANG